MFRRIEVALLVIVAMLFVPALARATQQLAPALIAGQASGFSRSCDAPPDRVQGSAPLSIATAGTIDATELATEPSERRSPHGHASDDRPLPTSVVVSPPDSLRAPPLRLA